MFLDKYRVKIFSKGEVPILEVKSIVEEQVRQFDMKGDYAGSSCEIIAYSKRQANRIVGAINERENLCAKISGKI